MVQFVVYELGACKAVVFSLFYGVGWCGVGFLALMGWRAAVIAQYHRLPGEAPNILPQSLAKLSSLC